MKTPKNIDVLFVAGFGPIVRDADASRKFYSEALGLPFEEETNGYLHTGGLDGVKHFALWPLAQAAESCFGADQWPDNIPVPQAWLEFDVVNIEKATAELKSQGYKLLVATRKEPWGQVVTRLLGTGRLARGHNPYSLDAEVNRAILSATAPSRRNRNADRQELSQTALNGGVTTESNATLGAPIGIERLK